MVTRDVDVTFFNTFRNALIQLNYLNIQLKIGYALCKTIGRTREPPPQGTLPPGYDEPRVHEETA